MLHNGTIFKGTILSSLWTRIYGSWAQPQISKNPKNRGGELRMVPLRILCRNNCKIFILHKLFNWDFVVVIKGRILCGNFLKSQIVRAGILIETENWSNSSWHVFKWALWNFTLYLSRRKICMKYQNPEPFLKEYHFLMFWFMTTYRPKFCEPFDFKSVFKIYFISSAYAVQ